MNWDFEKMYQLLSKENHTLLLDGKWGVERELQRVTNEGNLALTPHPAILGDKLKNPEITTDFAESQMELITPPFTKVEEVYNYLNYLYEKADKAVENEFLWPLSMPPRLPEEEVIPIARFGNTKEGKAAYRYRQGLANRYGKKMQMISGIHFNFSFGKKLLNILWEDFGENKNKNDFKDEIYFAVARNYLRYRWLLIYLFGASPSFDTSYDEVLKEQVEQIRVCCPECCNQFEQYATSLRVSRFGYSNTTQSKYPVYFNSKEEYIQKINVLLSKKNRRYAKLGIQLNDHILQKDSEFYSPIRLKQIVKQNESQLEVINKRGVEYAEIRILDINPFEKAGISLEQMYFLQVFVLFCLFEESRPLNNRETNRINKNHHLVALSGRRPVLNLNLFTYGIINLKDWGEMIFSKLLQLAGLLDSQENENVYSESVMTEYKKLTEPSLLPSTIMQDEMYNDKEGFLEYGMRIAKKYKANNAMEV